MRESTKKKLNTLCTTSVLALVSQPAFAADITVEVQNLTQGMYFTPVAVEAPTAKVSDNFMTTKGNTVLSVATMLVNSNDGFSGLNAWDLSQLALGESWSTTEGVYDAGSEVNSKAMGSMPGPADGGEGFKPMRNDTGFVAMHPGVVSMDGGLSSSVLTARHKFDNPAIHIMVTRTE
jgi:hypothetical protein